MQVVNKNLSIEKYKKEYAHYFESLNKDWISRYFKMEPIDNFVLANPYGSIIREGGEILFALYKQEVIGTVALKKIDNNTFELTKMAVDQNYRKLGAGKLLGLSAIEEAKKMNALRVILYSNTKLSAAIELYRKIGFKETPLEPGIYQRANIKMEFLIKQTNEN